MVCPCCVPLSGACCEPLPLNQFACTEKTEEACSQVAGSRFNGQGTSCAPCDRNDFSNCTVTVTTAFGSLSVSCGTRFSQLQSACGFVREFNQQPFPVGNVALLSLVPDPCVSPSLVAGSQNCDALLDTATISVSWNVIVAVRSEQTRTGLGGGASEEIVSLYALAFTSAGPTLELKWSGHVGFGILGGNYVGPEPPATAPPGTTVIDGIEGKRCTPCGFTALGFQAGYTAQRVYGTYNDIDCCAGDISHSIQIACPP
jgi:hypothetical protein